MQKERLIISDSVHDFRHKYAVHLVHQIHPASGGPSAVVRLVMRPVMPKSGIMSRSQCRWMPTGGDQEGIWAVAGRADRESWIIAFCRLACWWMTGSLHQWLGGERLHRTHLLVNCKYALNPPSTLPCFSRVATLSRRDHTRCHYSLCIFYGKNTTKKNFSFAPLSAAFSLCPFKAKIKQSIERAKHW